MSVKFSGGKKVYVLMAYIIDGKKTTEFSQIYESREHLYDSLNNIWKAKKKRRMAFTVVEGKVTDMRL